MAQFGKLISFIGSKRLVFRENFSHSARDKIARATGGAGHRGNGRPDWSNLRVDVEGDDFVECTVYYIQCDLGNCIMNIMFVCLFRCCSFWSTWDQRQSGLFLLGFRTQVDSMGFGTQRSQMQRRLDTKTSPRGSWGSWASGRNPKFLLCNLWLWKRYHQRPHRWIHESLGEKSPSEKGNEIQRSNRNPLHLDRLVSWPRKQAHSNDKYSELIFVWQSWFKRVIRLLMRD